MKRLYFSLLFTASLAAFPLLTQAADFSTDDAVTTQADYSSTFDSSAGVSTTSNVTKTEGSYTLKQAEGSYVTRGKIKSTHILVGQYQYFESASVTIDADIPNGTSIDLYLKTADQTDPGLNISTTFTKINQGEKTDIGAFAPSFGGRLGGNKLVWEAILRTTDPTKTPTLNSVTITYYNATHQAYPIQLVQNTFGVNKTTDASVKVTISGYHFQKDNEEVYFKNLFDASSVQYVDHKTLIATFPISSLSAGTYTVVVKNKNSGRLELTDGTPLHFEDYNIDEPQYSRLVLKWYAPEVTGLSSDATYTNGGTINLTGNYFSYGTAISFDGRTYIPSDAVTVLDEHHIKIDLTSGIITSYGVPRNTNITLHVRTPDYQTTTVDGLYVR